MVTKTRKTIGFAILILLGMAARAGAQDGPLNAQPGKCYAKCYMPDQFETVNERVKKTQDTGTRDLVRTVKAPAVFETVTEPAEIKPAGKRLVPIPAVFETVNEKVEIKGGGKRLIIQPAQYELVVESSSGRKINVSAEYETIVTHMVVKSESTRLIEIPAVYDTVVAPYVIEPANIKVETLQPKYETVTEEFPLKPAYTKWVRKKIDAACLNANPDDCFVWCMVEVPAEYQKVTMSVNRGCDGFGKADGGCTRYVEAPAKMGTRTVYKLKKTATVHEERVPAEYKTLTIRRVKTPATSLEEAVKMVKAPATVREEDIPAEHITVSRQILRYPAATREEPVPAAYEMLTRKVIKTPVITREEPFAEDYQLITKRILTKAGGFAEWREVLCEEKISGEVIGQIQRALQSRGYDPGPPDNTMNARTKAAMLKFQKDKGLPVGSLNMETLKVLGVNY